MLDFLLPPGSLFPVELFPVGLSFSEPTDCFGLKFGFTLPRRMPRDEVLPLTSKVSVGVRRKLSEIKKITLLSEIRMYMFPDNCQLRLLR